MTREQGGPSAVGLPGSQEDLASSLTRCFFSAVRELDPAELVFATLPSRPPRSAVVHVIAAGKAAVRMTEGLLRRWNPTGLGQACRGLGDVLVVTTRDLAEGAHARLSDLAGPAVPVEVLAASHPLPDASSEAAAAEALRRARGADPHDLVVSLVSGGASALLSSPAPGLSLAETTALVARLLDSGASIKEVNTVRRHLSRIKGGHLAAAAAPARVLTLVLSDVIDGGPHDVGSGPTVPDPTTAADAAAVLSRHLGPAEASRFVPLLRESLEPGAAGHRLRATVIADPPALARTLAAAITRDTGLAARPSPPDAEDVARTVERRLEAARSLRPGEAIVVPCEPTLCLPPSRGRGGRAGWVALAAARRLPDDVVLLCGASDGSDGGSGNAGAVVSRASVTALDDATIDASLARFDDAKVHEHLGTRIRCGATGTNLADVHVVARMAG